MKRIKVLALVAEAYGSGGGIAQFNRHLLDTLAAIPELEVTALGLYGARDSGEPPGLRWSAPARGGKAGYALGSAAVALRVRPHLIISGLIGFGGIALPLKLVHRSRLWSVLHGWEAWSPRRWADNEGLRRSEMVTTVSRYTRSRLLDWCAVPPERVKLLPNTIDLERFKPGPRPRDLERKYGVEGKKVLLTIGRLAAIDRYKGQDRVIPLMPELNRAAGPVHYIIAGDGDDRPRLEELVRSTGTESFVTFAGFVSDEEIEDLYRLADAFVMPSTGEGFGIVYLEAMVCGCPVIAGDRDGSVDALADGELGRLIDPESPQQLLEAILATLAEGRRHDARIAGVEHFSLPHFRRRVAELVDHVRGS